MDDDPSQRNPTLEATLNGTAAQPYFLGNFRSFLSQNNCAEILDFLEEAKRYRESYSSIDVQLGHLSYNSSGRPEFELSLGLWQRLLSTFVLPRSSQEIDLTSDERTYLLGLKYTIIPPPPFVIESVVARLNDRLEETMFPTFLHYGDSERHFGDTQQKPCG